jgi:hypothetical protein
MDRAWDEARRVFAATCLRKGVSMPQDSGLFQKFWVRRVDGRDRPGGDREGAVYFVLDVVHDTEHAAAALAAYADSCQEEQPTLASALDLLVAELDSGTPGPMVQALREPKREG